MKKIIFILVFLCTLFINLLYTTVKAEVHNDYEINMKRDILCLMMAYPEHIEGVEKGDNDKVYIIMKSGRKILYDDKKQKNLEEKFFNTDIQDMMEQKYPLNSIQKVMDKGFDPGRLRVYPLLDEVYGNSKKEVESYLKMSDLVYRKIQFNGNNNAAPSLEKAMKEIMGLCQQNSKIWANIFPCSGTYNYRNISGTNLKSPHSFGIAIDLSRDKRDYWKWADRTSGSDRINSYPKEIVSAFEKNNFVWGGKWSHFDILHFEYRPEIILKARYFGNKKSNINKWYEGVPYGNSDVKSKIKKIDQTLIFN